MRILGNLTMRVWGPWGPPFEPPSPAATDPGRVYTVAASGRTYTVLASNRTYTVEAGS